MNGWRRSAAAGLLLLAVYVGLSFLNSSRGFLGTDTGGKVATMKVMTERGRFDPDLGYWAEEWDPGGSLHPLALTSQIGHRWVNVTTLPALWVGWQLYRVGGYRGALLVPMAGSIAAAFAARALARLLGATPSWSDGAFWLVGLASPLTIYALDFWEHSLGVALLGWSVVLVVAAPLSSRRVVVAGALAGAAATMRTEALVYTAVLAAGVLVLVHRERRAAARAIVAGASFASAGAAVFLAGALVERQVLASSIRPARAAGTALGAGAAASTRLEEAAVTTVAFGGRAGIVLGAMVVLLLVLATAPRVRRTFPLLAGGALVGALASYAAVIAGGLGFVPGVVPTAPTSAVVAGVAPERRRHGFVVAVAVAAVPLVILFQFVGGAGPQWGGRYLLPSSLLLLVAGWVRLAALDRRTVAVVAGLGVAVTAYGVVWLQARSHQVERAIATIERRPEDVILSSVGHLAREGGATYGERRWLTRNPGSTARDVAAVLDGASADRVATVELASVRPRPLPGFEAVERSDLRLFEGVDLRITSWERSQ